MNTYQARALRRPAPPSGLVVDAADRIARNVARGINSLEDAEKMLRGVLIVAEVKQGPDAAACDYLRQRIAAARRALADHRAQVAALLAELDQEVVA